MCEICNGYIGCTVCSDRQTIACPLCEGTGTLHQVGFMDVNPQEYLSVLKVAPRLCSNENCPECKGEGRIEVESRKTA